ncbi:hypothetical protein KAFR_0J02990 [Kazachstania africana CBS 2517]|uniref:chitinase n=1 Tax=Kazachstania africana (strain ATCC 22294 / BCRC 22015 / CBS 2517 / CECT 1963 / NBRC 1671 / NRRL Y-8276) TaxID=1071382 RepID=H2B163_KAZAF|nr:hypothetical protein KAFR_0J02990 [Kazachstania africana CBS 2517]CCF60363.1 hypothetical protein KAFR_0J02990 [Kazachstania africana CBS 2517]
MHLLSVTLINNIFILLAATFTTVVAFDINSNTNVAVYWGQNSYGSQTNLANYCQSSDADIFLLSFLNNFPDLGLNFANACGTTFPGSTLLHCTQIAADIKTCQSLGKKVLLSLGGAVGSYGFSSEAEAETFADTLWATFGEGSGVSNRPFDDSIVDGFDFDIENNNPTGYAALVTKLRTLFKSGSKTYYIGAAPQCVYPDASVGNLLSNADVDFAFIQFYNNYCNVDKQFNFDTWANFAKTVSPNRDIKLFVGLPGGASAAGSGYISDMSVIRSMVQTVSENANFGGISLWDASQAWSNKVDGSTYVHWMKSILEEYASSSTSTTTTSKTTTSKTTTTTPTTPTTTSKTSTTTSKTTTTTTSTTSKPTTLSPTTTTKSSSTKTTTTSTSTATSALEQACHLNDLYSQGLYNGQSTCSTGQTACDSAGNYAVCENGSWTSTSCAAGTTCFAYAYNNQVLTGCNWPNQKPNCS